MKICSTCKVEKDLTEFTKNSKMKDGLKINCVSCCKQYIKNYYINNKEKEKIRGLNYDKNNRNIRRKWKNEYYSKNKDKINNKRYTLRKENKSEYNRKLKANVPLYLKHLISSSIRSYLKNNGFRKKSRTHQILGCSPMELKLHLESKFDSWMSWENHGKYNGQLNYGWDIDHIIPISSAKTEEDILNLNHYTNLQPLCSYINRFVKSDKIDYLC